jgi:ElaB/YqjD/DUF883 family membrane-anchored ribosome-binding protein
VYSKKEEVVDNSDFGGGLKTNPNNPNAFSGGTMNGESTDKNVQDAIGHAQSAIGSAKDAVGSGVQAANTEIDALKDQIAKLAQSVSQLVQSQASTAKDQMMSAVGSAGDSLSKSASAAHGTLTSVEHDVESRIKNNPWAVDRSRARVARGPARRQGALVIASSKRLVDVRAIRDG